MSDLSHMRKKNKFFQLHLKNSKRFCSFQYLFNKKVMIKAFTISMLFAFYFSLTWDHCASGIFVTAHAVGNTMKIDSMQSLFLYF